MEVGLSGQLGYLTMGETHKLSKHNSKGFDVPIMLVGGGLDLEGKKGEAAGIYNRFGVDRQQCRARVQIQVLPARFHDNASAPEEEKEIRALT
jgi:hypothetical protein